MNEQHRRRIDQILDPSYVEGIDGFPVDDVREKLRAAREEEESLSYVRRLLHGRADLLAAELEARNGGRGTIHGIDALSSALGIEATGSRGGRPSSGLRAAAVAGRREAERVISDDHLARLPDLTKDELGEAAERVKAAADEIAASRKRLFGVIDALEGELAQRYKSGSATPLV
jgi:hypothetical protein